MLNETVIEGRIIQDVELKTTESGVSVCSFSIAHRRDYKIGDEYPTDFFDVVAWRKKAELVCKHFKKGDLIKIVGSFETRKYTDKNGNNRVAYELKADKLYFGERRSQSDAAPAEEAPHFGNNQGGSKFDPNFTPMSDDDDLPF